MPCMRPHGMRCLGKLSLAVFCISVACEVDHRQLTGVSWTPDTAGSGSAASSAGGNGTQNCPGNNTPNSDAGAEGGSTSAYIATCSQGGKVAIATCPDLNQNDVPDDTETLVDNATFEYDTDGWDFETGVGLGWNVADACGRSDSGAVSVSNQFAGLAGANAQNGARQCLDVATNHIYAVWVNALPSSGSFGGLGLAFYASTDCSGTPIKQFNSTLVEPNGAWQVTSISGAAPDDSHSVAVRLFMGAPAPLAAGVFANVYFDNILLVKL